MRNKTNSRKLSRAGLENAGAERTTGADGEKANVDYSAMYTVSPLYFDSPVSGSSSGNYSTENFA